MPRRRTVTSPSFDPGDIGGGSDDDSSGGGGGNDSRDRDRDDDPPDPDPGSVTRDRGGAGAGGGGEPTVGVGDSDDGGSTGPSRQGRDDRGGSSPGGSSPPASDVGGPGSVTDPAMDPSDEQAAGVVGDPGAEEDPSDTPAAGTVGGDGGGSSDPLDPSDTPAAGTVGGDDGGGSDPLDPSETDAATEFEDPVQGVETDTGRVGEIASEFEESVVEEQGLTPEDVRITRDDDQLVAELTGTGETELRRRAVEQQREDAERQARLDRRQAARDADPRGGAVEGGDQRLFNEAAEQRRPEEQFGDDPVQNPVTGNRLETDLEGLSDRFQSGATDALRSVSARPDRTGVSTVRQTAVETADPFQLALAAKEGVEFVGDVRDRVPADDISNQERLDALADGELPESDSRESFVDDVEERTGAIARGTVDRATSSPGEFGLEVATGFVGGTVAASAARRGTQVARSADVGGRVPDELEAVRTFARDDRAMADFPEQRTITREETVTRQSDLDRLETAVEDMTLRDRARQRLPPREEFESDAAFERELDALEQRLAERELEEIAEDTDADAATQQGDDLLDDLQDEQTAGTQRRGRGRQREAEATVDRDSEGLLTDVAAGTTAATGTQLEAEATQVAGQQGAVGASLGLQQGTQLNQGIQTDLADDVSIGITADTTAGQPTDTIGGQQTTTQTGTQTTTTTTTTTTRGSSGGGGTRGRPRPELPDFDNSADDEEFDLDSGLGEETVVNPTRTLQEVDDDLQAMFDGGADRGP